MLVISGERERAGTARAFEPELARLLAEGDATCRDRERSAFDLASSGGDGTIVLFGAGRLGRTTLTALRNVRRTPLAFADNNPALWGTAIDGVPVLSPAVATARFGKRSTFVVTIWRAVGPHRYEHSRRQLQQLGCARVVPIALLAWKYPEELLPHYCLDLPHKVIAQADDVSRCSRLLSDGGSRDEFLAQLRFRLLADFDGLPHPESHPQYLAPDLFRYDATEASVDAGAYAQERHR